MIMIVLLLIFVWLNIVTKANFGIERRFIPLILNTNDSYRRVHLRLEIITDATASIIGLQIYNSRNGTRIKII